jgi:hypothetical protein
VPTSAQGRWHVPAVVDGGFDSGVVVDHDVDIASQHSHQEIWGLPVGTIMKSTPAVDLSNFADRF